MGARTTRSARGAGTGTAGPGRSERKGSWRPPSPSGPARGPSRDWCPHRSRCHKLPEAHGRETWAPDCLTQRVQVCPVPWFTPPQLVPDTLGTLDLDHRLAAAHQKPSCVSGPPYSIPRGRSCSRPISQSPLELSLWKTPETGSSLPHTHPSPLLAPNSCTVFATLSQSLQAVTAPRPHPSPRAEGDSLWGGCVWFSQGQEQGCPGQPETALKEELLF